MTDITETIRAFRLSSDEVWDRLTSAGVQPNDDEFLEAMNSHFQAEVGQSLNMDVGVYAFYSAQGESQNKIHVSTIEVASVLVGKLEGEARLWQWTTLDSARPLEFRELTHPENWRKKSSLDWAYCEDVVTGDHVCVPLSNAVFTINDR
jgi:hypothetical protein